MSIHQMAPIPEHWHSGDVTAGGVRIHYTRTSDAESGGQKKALVLAHGFSDDGLYWTPVAKTLEAEFDVVMVDARGHGFSEAPESGYSSPEMAHDLAGVIGALELESPFILGHSMGAATSLTLAGLCPEIPSAILLEDPPARWKEASPDASPRDAWMRRMRSWIVELQQLSRGELIERQKREAPSWSAVEVECWADAHLRMSLNIFNGSGKRELADPDQLRRIACPVLLITADPERGAIVTPEDGEALRTFIPQLTVRHITGAGHSIHREQFEPFMEEVQSFLRQSSS
jgi:N-formylmaleamate deformylase